MCFILLGHTILFMQKWCIIDVNSSTFENKYSVYSIWNYEEHYKLKIVKYKFFNLF